MNVDPIGPNGRTTHHLVRRLDGTAKERLRVMDGPGLRDIIVRFGRCCEEWAPGLARFAKWGPNVLVAKSAGPDLDPSTWVLRLTPSLFSARLHHERGSKYGFKVPRSAYSSREAQVEQFASMLRSALQGAPAGALGRYSPEHLKEILSLIEANRSEIDLATAKLFNGASAPRPLPAPFHLQDGRLAEKSSRDDLHGLVRLIPIDERSMGAVQASDQSKHPGRHSVLLLQTTDFPEDGVLVRTLLKDVDMRPGCCSIQVPYKRNGHWVDRHSVDFASHDGQKVVSHKLNDGGREEMLLPDGTHSVTQLTGGRGIVGPYALIRHHDGRHGVYGLFPAHPPDQIPWPKGTGRHEHATLEMREGQGGDRHLCLHTHTLDGKPASFVRQGGDTFVPMQ